MRNLCDYHRPKTLDDALRLLNRKGLRTVSLAGGTQLVAEGPLEIESVVDLDDLGLDYIECDDAGLRVGALTRLAALAESPSVRIFADEILADAIHHVATSLLRNQGRVAGALLTRLGNADLPPVLLAMDAEVSICRTDGLIRLPLATLYNDLELYMDRAILAELRVPAPPPDARVRCHRVARTPTDQAILTVTALTRVINGTLAECRVAAAGVGSRPMRLSKVESALVGLKVEANSIQAAVTNEITLDMPNDLLASAEYRRAVLPVLIRRAVTGD